MNNDKKERGDRAEHTISGGQREAAKPDEPDQQGLQPDLNYHGLLLYGPSDRARNPPSPYAGSSTGSSHKGGSGSAGQIDPADDGATLPRGTPVDPPSKK
jgi:hypothetical protein